MVTEPVITEVPVDGYKMMRKMEERAVLAAFPEKMTKGTPLVQKYTTSSIGTGVTTQRRKGDMARRRGGMLKEVVQLITTMMSTGDNISLSATSPC